MTYTPDILHSSDIANKQKKKYGAIQQLLVYTFQ